MDAKPSPSRLSLRDIAKFLNISHSTVSLALRNHPRISEAVREKVKQTALELGYKPDPMLAALSNYRKSKSDQPISAELGWINGWNDPKKLRTYKEFDLYWKGASAAANKFGYRLEEFCLGGDLTPKRLHQILSTRGIRGLLIPPHKDHPDWGDFPWEEYSIVRFGRTLQTPQSHIVTADQVANTMLAFRRMRERGYQRIGFVTDEDDTHERGQLFEAGYLIAQRSIAESERLPVFITNGFAPGERKKAFASWLEKHRPDAIFTDVIDFLDLLKRAAPGMSVPDSFGLAVTSVLDGRADSGIDQNAVEIGRVGFLMLNSLINDGALGIPKIFRQILVEGSWVDGKSLPLKSTAQD
ncbi:MAG: LacI family DNA-binding transcriptional regulator [Luteolibacter sp.]